MSQLRSMPAVVAPVEFDIAVVGAGLVGLPVAHALANQGWRVGLLDAEKVSSQATQSQPDESDRPDSTCEPDSFGVLASSRACDKPAVDTNLEQRCTALSLGTQQWYERQGLWGFVAEDACAINRVNVSHKGFFGATRLDAKELGVEAVGYVVNNAEFTRQQQRHLENSPVAYFDDARVASVDHHADAVILHTQNHRAFRARLLIAADGIGSVVRESAGIAVRQIDYQQSAVLGMVRLANEHTGVAHERFTPSGPLAMLPRTGPYMSFVDCIEPESQEAVASMSNHAYLTRLQDRFGYRLGRMSAVGPRFVTPLLRLEAEQQTAARTVLLGNAARLLHPVGGQGYNLAMRDVAQLVDLLDPALTQDPGNAELLTRFVNLRTADQRRVVQFTDVLARGFRGGAALPGHLRSAALLGLDTLSPLRRKFASYTMGQSGNATR